MESLKYDKEMTALLVIDPYNDFISEGGKIWDRIRAVAEANDCVPNMLQVLNAARKAELRVFYALHHRYRPGDYETWKYIAPIQKAGWLHKAFENGTWGGEIRKEFEPQPGDIAAQEHWCSSGFANTDLDLQLKKHGIHKLIVIGLIAHTCVEATVRFAAELGYEVTVVKDATADYSDEEMHAALEVNLPNYASAIVTTNEVVDSIRRLRQMKPSSNDLLQGEHTMTHIEKVLYTAKAHTTGGRDGGASRTSDGRLDVKLSVPGTSGTGTNPEQLFAVGWSACFLSAIKVVAGRMKVRLPAELVVDSEVDLGTTGGGYLLQARLNVSLPGIEREIAQALVDGAHKECPYSKATHGNINVVTNLVGVEPATNVA